MRQLLVVWNALISRGSERSDGADIASRTEALDWVMLVEVSVHGAAKRNLCGVRLHARNLAAVELAIEPT